MNFKCPFSLCNLYLDGVSLVLDKPEYQKDKLKMEQLFMECIKREFNTCAAYKKLADYREPINTTTR